MTPAQLLQLRRAASDRPAARQIQGRGMVAAAQALARRGLVTLTPRMIKDGTYGSGRDRYVTIVRADITNAGRRVLIEALDRRVAWLLSRWLSHAEQRELERMTAELAQLDSETYSCRECGEPYFHALGQECERCISKAMANDPR